MTPEVQTAVDELRATFPNATVTAVDTGDGGANVVLEPIDLGPPYEQADTWIGFNIGFQYPYSDIYPLFVRADLTRKDGTGYGEGVSAGHSFAERAAVQLSRKSNKLNPSVDTAALKVTKVLAWLRSL